MSLNHYCLSCCTRWSVGKCTNKCTHKIGEVCDKQKEGLKLKLSIDELPNNWEWEGFLGGSYYNTYALAEICLSKIKGFHPEAKIIKVKNKQGEIHFKIMYYKK